MRNRNNRKTCHPERPKGVEGSTHLRIAVQIFTAKIPPRAAHGGDDRRRISSLIAVVLCLTCILSLFTGCHGAKERVAFQVPQEFDTSKTYEITFWAKNDTNLTQANIYRKAIEDFQALYPNIKVKLKLYTDYGRIYQDVITNIATDTTPNVCITYPDHIATYMQGQNVVASLDELFAHEKYGLGGSELRFDGPSREEIVPKFLEECMVSGKYYAIPYMRSTEACYVNKTYVEKLGYELPEELTWDFVFEVSAAAMEKDQNGLYKVNGQQTMLPFMYKSTDNMMIQMLKQLDAGYSTDSGRVLLFNDTTKAVLKDIYDSAEIWAFYTFKTGYPANYLNAGQCIFAVDSTAGATWMGSDAPLVDIPEEDIVDFETVVMKVPQYDPENPQMISQGPSICVFNKADQQEVLASWLSAQSLLTDEVKYSYATTEGYVPVTTKTQQSQAYRDYLSRAGEDDENYYQIKMDATNLLLDNIENTFVTPVFNGSTDLRNAAGHLIEEIVADAHNKKNANDAYFEELFNETTSLYRLDQIQTNGSWKQELGPLPQTAVALIITLAAVWVILGALFLRQTIKSGKQAK